MKYNIYLELHSLKDKNKILYIKDKLNIKDMNDIKFKENLVYYIDWRYNNNIFIIKSRRGDNYDFAKLIYQIYFKSEADMVLFKLKYGV